MTPKKREEAGTMMVNMVKMATKPRKQAQNQKKWEPETVTVPPYGAAMTVTSSQFQGFLRKVNFPMQRPLDKILTSTSNMKTAEKANLQMQSGKKGFHLLSLLQI